MITFMGTSGSITTKDRHNTSLLYQVNDTSILIDCNGRISQNFSALSQDIAEIEHIIFTHSHIDHISAFPSLLHQIWVKSCLGTTQPRTTPLKIYSNQSTITKIKKLVAIFDLLHHPHIFPLEYFLFDSLTEKFNIKDITVNFFKVNHGPTETHGLLLKHPDHYDVLYSSDTEPCETVLDRIKRDTIIIHECNKIYEKTNPEHTTLSQIKDMFKNREFKSLHLVHLPIMTTAETEKASQDITEFFGDKARLANDMETITTNI